MPVSWQSAPHADIPDKSGNDGDGRGDGAATVATTQPVKVVAVAAEAHAQARTCGEPNSLATETIFWILWRCSG